MTLVEVSALVGMVMPALVAVVNQPWWKPWQRALVPVVASLIAGAVTSAASGQFDGKGFPAAAAITFGSALATYKAWWKPSDIAAMIERFTTVSRSSPAPAAPDASLPPVA